MSNTSRSTRPAATVDESLRPFMDPSQPGRLDRDGVQWYATDPYPTWFRRDADGAVIHRPWGDGFPGWADQPVPTKPQPCSSTCRLTTWSNHCECQGWCL